MSTQRFRLGLVAALVLLAIVLLGHNVMEAWQGRAQPTSRADVVDYQVLRANKLIPKGAVIVPDDLKRVMLSAPPAAGTFTRLAQMGARIATRNIAEGDVLSRNNTAPFVQPTTLADAVPAGLRAISLHVTRQSGLSNLLRPGDHVDVLIVSNTSRAGMDSDNLFAAGEVRTLLQDVPVLAVGRSISRNAAADRNSHDVTLAVSPQDAEVVALIRSIGHEYLVLRRDGDNTITDPAPVSTATLGRTLSSQKPADHEGGRMTGTIEVIRGANPATTVSVDGGAS